MPEFGVANDVRFRLALGTKLWFARIPKLASALGNRFVARVSFRTGIFQDGVA